VVLLFTDLFPLFTALAVDLEHLLFGLHMLL